jgi:catechol 2,3-dioxygenase-like lactoylglutathione lyase family enzyme
MIAHISIGVRGIERSRRFYDAALEPLGYKYLRAARTLLGYGYGRDSIALWVVQGEHPVPADNKSSLHFCFTAANAAAVEALHAAALRSGGNDNGTPGMRPIYGPDYYAAFIIECLRGRLVHRKEELDADILKGHIPWGPEHSDSRE